MKICKKAENDIKLNSARRNFDCEGLLNDPGDSELKWFTEWYKDALKNKDYDWSKYRNDFQIAQHYIPSL